MLKLILIGLTPLIGSLQVLLDHKWHDKRTKKHKFVLRALLLLMFLAAAGAILVEVQDQRRVEARQKEIRAKMLQQIQVDWIWNFAQIQLKGGGTFGLITNPTRDSESFRFQLSLITSS